MDSVLVNILVAVITAIITYFLTSYFKQSGKIIVTLPDYGFTFQKSDGSYTQSINKAQMLTIELSVSFYNSSDVPKNLSDIGLEFNIQRRKKGERWSVFHPLITSEYPNRRNIKDIEYLNFISLQPRELKIYYFKAFIDKNFFTTLEGGDNLYLTASYPNGKKFSAFLTVTKFDEG